MNIEHVIKIDEVGKEVGFTCYDSDGSLVDLTNYTVTLNVKQGATLVTDDATVTKRTQTGATLGQCYHTWTAASIPNAVGTYTMELKAVFGSNVLYFPTDKDRMHTYMKLYVQAALG